MPKIVEWWELYHNSILCPKLLTSEQAKATMPLHHWCLICIRRSSITHTIWLRGLNRPLWPGFLFLYRTRRDPTFPNLPKDISWLISNPQIFNPLHWEAQLNINSDKRRQRPWTCIRYFKQWQKQWTLVNGKEWQVPLCKESSIIALQNRASRCATIINNVKIRWYRE